MDTPSAKPPLAPLDPERTAIQRQVRLPLAAAFEVVLQGIRIRMGRSIVTLLGVVLGIAFLMSILTGGTIRKGVAEETALRVEQRRMQSFLIAETGPLAESVVQVVAVGPLSDLETRFLIDLARGEATTLDWTGATEPPPTLRRAAGTRLRTEPPPDRPAPRVHVIAGAGVPAWPGLADAALVALTRSTHAGGAPAGRATVQLERELRPEEIAQAELEARRAVFRTRWIVVISLLVTVIGISNAMLMSVTERFREIGTMKCLGALSSFIRQVFFVESSLMGCVGSLAGALLGFALAAVGYGFSYGAPLVLAAIEGDTALGHAGLCIACGVVLSVVAAIYPATLASRMVPATALRSTV